MTESLHTADVSTFNSRVQSFHSLLNRNIHPVNQSNRVEKIQKYQDKKKLETKLEEMEKRPHVDEEVSVSILEDFSVF